VVVVAVVVIGAFYFARVVFVPRARDAFCIVLTQLSISIELSKFVRSSINDAAGRPFILDNAARPGATTARLTKSLLSG